MEEGNSIKGILESVIHDVRPTLADRGKEEDAIRHSFKVLQSIIKKRGLKVKPLLVGSIAKDTDLRFDKDIDIFLLFEKGVPREVLETEGLAIGKEFFSVLRGRWEVNYAEHPYTKGRFKE
ncbi:MAG: nucleotidyltransferase domain-containing protein, partial [Candidatus Altiarchaeota archaeon]|nr:nucleotidyltransferase domain-containing protein [Candidatus Altiarchaeota archaeon]